MKKVMLYFFLITSISCNRGGNQEGTMSKEAILLDSLTKMYKSGDTIGSLNGTKEFILDHSYSDAGYNLLSIIYLALNEDSLSKVNAEIALKLNEKNYGAMTNYGILLEKNGDIAGAEKYFKQAIEIEPKFVQPYSHLMAHYFRLHKYEEAKLYGEKAISLGDNVGDRAILCVIYHELGLKSKRDTMYQELIKLKYVNIIKVRDIISGSK